MGDTNQKPKRIWGLDLAGLGTANNTGLAMIEMGDSHRNELVVTVFTGHPFDKKYEGTTQWKDEGIKTLVRCLQKWTDGENHLYVDIPIDLQGLPWVPDPLFVWQTKQRVVDRVFDGLRPLASNIGAQTADFQFLAVEAGILSGPDKRSSNDNLGTTLFEAYPRATLSKAIDGGIPPYKQRNAATSDRLEMQRELGVRKPVDNLNHDQIDAIICALVGAGGFTSLTKRKLTDEWKKWTAKKKHPKHPATDILREPPDFFMPPRGYRVVPPTTGWLGGPLSVEIKCWSDSDISSP